MEDPVSEIPGVIRSLCQTPPSVQRATIERHFTPDASFTHPFCRTGSFHGSRWLIWCIYRWYKIMSPRIEMDIDSVAYDSKTLTLYVSLHQTFRIFLLPSFFACHARLTTVLQLVPLTSSSVNSSGTKTKYLISSQNDLYQTSEFVKFFSLFRFVYLGVLLWQFIATMFCVVGAVLGEPVSWVEENMVGGNWEKSVVKDVALAEKPREALLEKRGSLEDGRRDNVDEEREEIVGSERGESLEDEREETVSSLG